MQHSPPLRVEFTSEAKLDYFDILLYTEENFGVRQVAIYEDWLNAAIERISQKPELGKRTIMTDCFRYHISWAGNRGSHYLYYRISDETLTVIRILHQSRDYINIYPFNRDPSNKE